LAAFFDICGYTDLTADVASPAFFFLASFFDPVGF